MNRVLPLVSFVASAAALGFYFLPPSGFNTALLMISSLAAVTAVGAELALHPGRALYLLGLLPGLPLAFLLIQEHPETGPVGLVVFLAALQARLFFLRTAKNSQVLNRQFAGDLRGSLPTKARIFVDIDIEGEAPLSDLREGHLIRVQPADRLPVDGQVTFGSSFVDESSLTGDQDPKAKSMGSFVLAGSENKNGTFIYRASGSAGESGLQRLAAGLEREFGRSLVNPGYLALEGFLYLGVLFLTYRQAPTETFLAFFLVSQGTAFALALKVNEFSFLARSAAEGIAWRDRDSIQRVARTDLLVSGTTGVLTEGKFRLTGMLGSPSLSEDGALRFLGPLARRLETEAAFTILRELQTRNIRLEILDAYVPMPGGAAGIVAGADVRWIDLENARLEGIGLANFAAFAEKHVMIGEPVFLLLRDGAAAAAFAVNDQISPHAAEGLAALSREGIPFVILTPESQLALRPLQQELQLFQCHADSDESEAQHLLDKLGKEGLHPLWIEHAGWSLQNKAGAIVTTSVSSPALAQVFSLRRDPRSIVRLVKLARSFAAGSKFTLALSVLLQFSLMALATRASLVLAAAAGAAAGFFLLFWSKRALFLRF